MNRYSHNYIVILIFVCALIFIQTEAFATTVLYTDESQWMNLTGYNSVNNFDFNAVNVALADEVSSPPPVGAQLGQQLTFESGNTGLAFDFTFNNESSDPGTQIIFTDPVSLIPGLGSTPTTNHDWGVSFINGDPVFSIGLNLSSIQPSLIDAINVYGTSGDLLGSLMNPGDLGFIGIISDQAIGRISYDDNIAPGGKVLTNLVIPTMASVPEPAPFALLLVGIFALWVVDKKELGQKK